MQPTYLVAGNILHWWCGQCGQCGRCGQRGQVTISFWDCSGPGWAALVVSWFAGLGLGLVLQVGHGFVESAAGFATGSEASMADQRSSVQLPWRSIILSDLEKAATT